MFITLRSKIIAGYGVLVAVHLVFTLWAVNRFSTESTAATGAVGSYAARSTYLLHLATTASQLYGSLSTSASGEAYRRERSRFQELLQNGSRDLDGVLDSSLSVIDRKFRRFDTVARNWGEDMGQADLVESAFRDLILGIEEGGRESTRHLVRQRQVMSTSIQNTLATITLASLVAGIIGILAGVVYARWALQSIERLRTAVRHVSEGEFSQKIHITTADELGDLSFDFNRMIEQLHRYEAMNVESILLERRKAETVVRSIISPIILVDDEGEILLANSAARRLFGEDIDRRVEGLGIRELVDDPDIIAMLELAISGQTDRIERMTYSVEREGESHHYSVSIHPMGRSRASGDDGGSSGGVIMLFTDVTEFKAIDAMKSEILARVSHELRTPVASVLMSTDLLREGVLGELNERQREMVTDMKTDLRRLSTMIDEILKAARVEGVSSLHDLPPVPVEDSLRESVVRHRQISVESGVSFSVESSLPERFSLRILPEHLQLVFDNIVSNAIRFAGAGGNVRVSFERRREGGLIMSAADDGPGIPLSEQDRIFERFYQVDRGRANPPGSIGLGLSLVADVVRRYGGTVSVTSQEGEGALFTVEFPEEIVGREDHEGTT